MKSDVISIRRGWRWLPLAVFAALLIGTAPAGAQIVSATGNIRVVPAPPDARVGAFESNQYARAWDEQQGVTLQAPLTTDDPNTFVSSGVIPAGTIVDSQMIHSDPVGAGTPETYSGTVTFDSPVLGVIMNGRDLGASNFLGAPTTYGNNEAAELGQETVSVGPDDTTITFHTEPAADEVRVITAAAPSAQLSKSGLAFGDQTVGTAGAPMTETVTNGGPGPLLIQNVSIDGSDQSDFTVATDGCSGANLGPGDHCDIGVTFAPSDVGPRNAELVVNDNDPNGPQRAPLTGNGVANQLGGGDATCDGFYGGSADNVEVPSGANCTLVPGTTVTHNVTVDPRGTLTCESTTIGHDLFANHPSGIGVGSCQIGHDLHVVGVSGQGPGPNGDNYVCGSSIGHDVHIHNGAAGAGAFVIGDPPDCTGEARGNTIGHDLDVEQNADPIDVSENTVSHDVHVSGNTGGTQVSGNSAGHDAHCNANSPAPTGSANNAQHSNMGCPA